jgi:hypothetical protein
MTFVIINKKKYTIKKNEYDSFINFSKNKIGKIIYLSDDRKINKTLDSEGYNENPYREIEIHNQCNKIIKSKLTTNLVKIYDYHIYNNSIILIIDKYDGVLDSIIDKLNIDEIWSIFFQIFITFVIMQDKLGFYQGNFGLKNILYKKVSKAKKFFQYTYDGITYKVPNEGYKIAVSEYGNNIINTFIIADYEKEYYEINLSKRIELYNILLLLIKSIKTRELHENYKIGKKIKKITFTEKYKNKLHFLNNYIYNNVLFNNYNGIYTINDKYTQPANHKLLLEKLYT